MSNLSSRLQKHFVVCAAAAAAVATTANAGVVYSGPVSIVIPDTIDGVYMNVLNGATGSSGGAVAGWDINPYTAGAGNFNLWGPDANTWLEVGGNYNLPFNTPIGSGGTFGRPGGTATVTSQVNLNSDNNYFGFEFVAEGPNTTHYGWIQVRFADIGTREIIGYAFDDVAGTTIGAGVIPAPASMALLALGGLVGRRRR